MSQSLNNATIRFCEVSARRTSEDSHGAIDLTAFNTDGFDVSGQNIHIHDCAVWNQDDTFCIKAEGPEVTENVLIENVKASGVGLSIGSIGKGSVRNVTFRNVVMHHSSKGIYVKFRESGEYGAIEDVTYENIHIEKPESWAIWIGPQQAGIKRDNVPYNPCDGDPCSLCWPTTGSCPGVNGTIKNLVLRNITINKPALSPGVLIGGSDPTKRFGVTFDGVRFIDPPDDGKWGKKYFHSENVDGIALGDTWPIPPGFVNMTLPPTPAPTPVMYKCNPASGQCAADPSGTQAPGECIATCK